MNGIAIWLICVPKSDTVAAVQSRTKFAMVEEAAARGGERQRHIGLDGVVYGLTRR